MRDPRRDGHQLVGDRRQSLDNDDPRAPLVEPGLERVIAVHRVEKFEDRPAEQVEPQ